MPIATSDTLSTTARSTNLWESGKRRWSNASLMHGGDSCPRVEVRSGKRITGHKRRVALTPEGDVARGMSGRKYRHPALNTGNLAAFRQILDDFLDVHLAVLVDSADEHISEAEELGVEVESVVDAANTYAVFVWGPERVRVEYVEHKPTFSLT